MSKTWRGDEPGMAFETGSPVSTRALAYCLNLMATFSCFLLVSFLFPEPVSSMLPPTNNMNDLDEDP
jgi:hypothetical protein